MTIELSRYLGVRAAATYLGCSPGSLYHLVARRQIPFLRRGNRLFFDRGDLDRWMRTGEQKPMAGDDGP